MTDSSAMSGMISDSHDDVTQWKHFPRYWPFVRGIHHWPVNSPHKGQRRGALLFSFIYDLNKRLSKQSSGWWFETPSRSLWRNWNSVQSHQTWCFEIVSVRSGAIRVVSPMVWIDYHNPEISDLSQNGLGHSRYWCTFLARIMMTGPDDVNAVGSENGIMMTSSNGNIFRVTGPLWGDSPGQQWIPLTKASEAERWCFLWSAPQQTVQQIIKTPVIWDGIAIAPIIRSL